jgi:hypothetical protein
MVGLRLLSFALVLTVAEPALSYVGPGASISLLGSLFGLIAAVIVGLGVVLVWPIRRLIRRGRAGTSPAGDSIAASMDAPAHPDQRAKQG